MEERDEMELHPEARRALGITIQILEELPRKQRPESNIEDMKGLLDGKPSGRDGFIMREAVATALVFRIKNALMLRDREMRGVGMNDRREGFLASLQARAAGRNNREEEFGALLELVGLLGVSSMRFYLVDACHRLRFENDPPSEAA